MVTCVWSHNGFMNERHHGPLTFRRATGADVPVIVAMLADDDLGAHREAQGAELPASYFAAFQAIDADPHQELVIAERDGEAVGTLQLTFLPYLTYQGGWRAQIEAVRVASQYRNEGLGHELFVWAIDRARERGCHLVQLTTDKRRNDAHRFYEDLGFVPSHEGMKLDLSKPN